MNKPNLDAIEEQTRKKAAKRTAKKKVKMKVSGGGVKKLQQLIKEKSK